MLGLKVRRAKLEGKLQFGGCASNTGGGVIEARILAALTGRRGKAWRYFCRGEAARPGGITVREKWQGLEVSAGLKRI